MNSVESSCTLPKMRRVSTSSQSREPRRRGGAKSKSNESSSMGERGMSEGDVKRLNDGPGDSARGMREGRSEGPCSPCEPKEPTTSPSQGPSSAT